MVAGRDGEGGRSEEMTAGMPEGGADERSSQEIIFWPLPCV